MALRRSSSFCSFVDLFDSTGTLVGVVYRARLLDADGHIPGLRRVLLSIRPPRSSARRSALRR
jgi:xanthine/uracil/vitamin C permease (AzgA family)